MHSIEHELLVAFELHSVERIRAVLDTGFDIRGQIRGKTPINWLVEMYTRSERFPDCLQLLLEKGADLDDPILASVLLNDADGLASSIKKEPGLLEHRTSLVCAFTPLVGVSLLHVAAEYGHVDVAKVLVEMGAPIEAKAAVDELGLNGQTALFHTVNSNNNHSEPVMQLLLDTGARCDIQLRGLTWGKGFDWETTFLDVTPISYAQLGLLPQMHRRELDVYANVQRLLQAAGRQIPPMENVPNRYLQGNSD